MLGHHHGRLQTLNLVFQAAVVAVQAQADHRQVAVPAHQVVAQVHHSNRTNYKFRSTRSTLPPTGL